MKTVSISIKDYERYIAIERGILMSLRLDPDDWAVCGLETDMGDVPFFTDQPTIITDTSAISELSLGSVTIDISYRHGKRPVRSHEAYGCCEPVAVLHQADMPSGKSPFRSVPAMPSGQLSAFIVRCSVTVVTNLTSTTYLLSAQENLPSV